MRRFLVILPLLFISSGVSATESYFLNNLESCRVLSYDNGSLKPASSEQFKDLVINVKGLPRNPSLVAFKYNEQIYVTKETCVVSAHPEKIKNELTGKEIKKRPNFITEQDKFNSYKFFIELDTGVVSVADKSSVVSDYNEAMPSSSTNPTTWGQASDSEYKSGLLFSAGFGFRTNKNTFLAFKFRMINGQKTDELTLTDVNTGISQSGSWTYEDSFKNFYGGYKFIFLDYSAWKPVIAGYLGVSQMTSTMSDGEESYKLTSIGPAALLEIGIEYHVNSHLGIGGMLGYEYLGNRNQKFAEESGGVNFKTNMSYNNQYLSLGVKYYFK